MNCDPPEPKECDGEQRRGPSSHEEPLLRRDWIGCILSHLAFIVGLEDGKVLWRACLA